MVCVDNLPLSLKYYYYNASGGEVNIAIPIANRSARGKKDECTVVSDCGDFMQHAASMHTRHYLHYTWNLDLWGTPTMISSVRRTTCTIQEDWAECCDRADGRGIYVLS